MVKEAEKKAEQAAATNLTNPESTADNAGTSGTQRTGKQRGRPRVISTVIKTKATKTAHKKSKKPNEPKEPVAGLTDKIIRELSTYYALAIQRHPDSLENMRKEIWATYYHKISTDEFPQHENCNVEWCQYIQHTAAGEEFVHPPSLDPDLQEVVKEVYYSLTDEELLQRCLGKKIRIIMSVTTHVYGSWPQNTTTLVEIFLK